VKKILKCSQELFYETHLLDWVVSLNSVGVPFASFVALATVFKPGENLVGFVLFSDVGLNCIYLFYFATKCVLFPSARLIYGLGLKAESESTKQHYTSKLST
jgi:hypothetical protein